MSQLIGGGYVILTEEGKVVTLEEYTKVVRKELIEESVKQAQGQGLKSWLRNVMTRAMEILESGTIENTKEEK